MEETTNQTPDMGQELNGFHFLNNQQPQPNSSRSVLKEFENLNFFGIMILVFVLFLVFVAVAVIRDLAGLGSWFGAMVIDWFKAATIDPGNKRGFANFLILLLTAGFIWLLLRLFTGKQKRGSYE
jgi:hypothetical protein